VDDEQYVIGVDYNKLSPENMVPVYLEGNILEGSLKPSS